MLAHFPAQFSYLPNGQSIGYAARPRPVQEPRTAGSDEKEIQTQPIIQRPVDAATAIDLPSSDLHQ